MTNNRTLREQVAEAINCVFNAAFERKDGKWPSVEAADAAIKAVIEGMRCGTCGHYEPESQTCGLLWRREKETHGCVNWEQKQ